MDQAGKAIPCGPHVRLYCQTGLTNSIRACYGQYNKKKISFDTLRKFGLILRKICTGREEPYD